MDLILSIPDELAARLGSIGLALERQALEALVLESFRSARLNRDEVGRILGLEGRNQVDGFLKAHDVFESATLRDVQREVATLARLGF